MHGHHYADRESALCTTVCDPLSSPVHHPVNKHPLYLGDELPVLGRQVVLEVRLERFDTVSRHLAEEGILVIKLPPVQQLPLRLVVRSDPA